MVTVPPTVLTSTVADRLPGRATVTTDPLDTAWPLMWVNWKLSLWGSVSLNSRFCVVGVMYAVV